MVQVSRNFSGDVQCPMQLSLYTFKFHLLCNFLEILHNYRTKTNLEKSPPVRYSRNIEQLLRPLNQRRAMVMDDALNMM